MQILMIIFIIYYFELQLIKQFESITVHEFFIFSNTLSALLAFINPFSPNLSVQRILFHSHSFSSPLSHGFFMWILCHIGIPANASTAGTVLTFPRFYQTLLGSSLRSFSRQLILKK